MKLAAAGYNERSWAIDLIGHVKQLSLAQNKPIKDASGEQTVRAEGGSLFPDVLLFGDKSTARILQGWELKMPDTDISDPEFRDNAEKKAKSLGLDSFVIWNVRCARLYTKGSDAQYSVAKEWNDLSDVTRRSGVRASRARWEKLAADIIGYLNDLFERGSLEGRQFIEAYQSGGITALIMENSGLVSTALRSAAARNSTLKAEIKVWWDTNRAEYGAREKEDAEDVLGRAILSNWIGKLLFAHILREKDTRAQAVATIGETTSPSEALKIFKQLSADCNFWNIFKDSVGLSEVPPSSWGQLKQFNKLLADLRVGSVDQAQLSRVLESTVEVAVRKVRGQYTTPIELARLLTALCVRNQIEDRVLDPCCGSGTIARAAIEGKISDGLSGELAAQSVFAGDQDPQAVQLATFALAKPSMMHIPLRIFQKDAFTLKPLTEIEFTNPSDGTTFKETLGVFDAITSNLPFVAQSGREQYENALASVNVILARKGLDFPGRADVAAYLPFALRPLLTQNGRMGIIITNAWLGTDYGVAFFKALTHYFAVKCVITSGAGRWFKNSKVVTNIIVLERRETPSPASDTVNFIVLKRRIEELADADTAESAAAQIIVGQSHDDTMSIRPVSLEALQKFRVIGLGGSAQFVNCDWALKLPLRPVRTSFSIRRGERRGMNALFYPSENHGIEADYIRPLAKTFQDFSRLSGTAEKEAFSCSLSKAALAAKGHKGALAWIKKFETPTNVAKLGTRKDTLWYEMKADEMSDLVMSMAYGSRLFVARLDPPAFVDQRLVRLDPKDGVDVALCHALLNSTISMFLIEGLGFGRGEGVLDLNKDTIEQSLHMLDPSKVDARGHTRILQAFKPLLSRDVMVVADEVEDKDRQAFDSVICDVFGLKIRMKDVYTSLVNLVAIRLTATEG
jgi:hypothetical protein